MDWLTWRDLVPVLSLAVTGLLGYLTWKRLSSGDKALNIATNIQSTYTAQAELIKTLQVEREELQKDVRELRADNREMRERLRGCESTTDDLRGQVDDLKAQLKNQGTEDG